MSKSNRRQALDPKVIAKGFANDGQDVPADGTSIFFKPRMTYSSI